MTEKPKLHVVPPPEVSQATKEWMDTVPARIHPPLHDLIKAIMECAGSHPDPTQHGITCAKLSASVAGMILGTQLKNGVAPDTPENIRQEMMIYLIERTAEETARFIGQKISVTGIRL